MDNSFNSLDRLLEFGMSMAVAQQMIATMNHVIDNMQTPGSGAPVIKTESQYYAIVDNVQIGPITEPEVNTLVSSYKIKEDTLMWKPGMSGWTQAKLIPEIMKLIILNKH
ncbi:MAG TPA: DUF4339 domain-containing protein [Candidatus Coprenecus pullistercoris]|nr:DUF4339 domain-containing protein [Candidatus Coprenecus pullistercoris]